MQNDECELDEIQHHSDMTYCPYCLDEWCANGVRLGLEFSDVACKVVDDRIVDRIKGLKGEAAKRHLVNVVTATDLVKSAEGPIWMLTRPEGPKPWEDGFEPPRPSNIKDWGVNIIELGY